MTNNLRNDVLFVIYMIGVCLIGAAIVGDVPVAVGASGFCTAVSAWIARFYT